MEFISHVFPENATRPSFISYDNACNLLRHIARCDVRSLWLHTTRFIVDAFHYVNHRATDALYRTQCNPSPENGSQPDLLIPQVNPATGHMVVVRAFNTEAAEQFNAWADGFEAQLRQMTNFTYDFTVHAALLLYKECWEEEIEQRGDMLAYEGREMTTS